MFETTLIRNYGRFAQNKDYNFKKNDNWYFLNQGRKIWSHLWLLKMFSLVQNLPQIDFYTYRVTQEVMSGSPENIVPGSADTTEPRSKHSVHCVPQRFPLDHGDPTEKMWRLLVPHSLHVHRGELPGLWHHHQQPVLCRPLQEGHQHPGAGPALHRVDGFRGGTGPHPSHQGEQKAVKHEEAPQLLQVFGPQRVIARALTDFPGTLQWLKEKTSSMGLNPGNIYEVTKHGDISVTSPGSTGLILLSWVCMTSFASAVGAIWSLKYNYSHRNKRFSTDEKQQRYLFKYLCKGKVHKRNFLKLFWTCWLMNY